MAKKFSFTLSWMLDILSFVVFMNDEKWCICIFMNLDTLLLFRVKALTCALRMFTSSNVAVPNRFFESPKMTGNKDFFDLQEVFMKGTFSLTN